MSIETKALAQRKLYSLLERLVNLNPDNPRFQEVYETLQQDAVIAISSKEGRSLNGANLASARTLAIESRRQKAEAFRDEIIPLIILYQRAGLSLNDISDAFVARGIPTYLASRWNKHIIFRLLQLREPRHEPPADAKIEGLTPKSPAPAIPVEKASHEHHVQHRNVDPRVPKPWQRASEVRAARRR